MQAQNLIGGALIAIGIIVASGLLGQSDLIGIVILFIGLFFIYWKKENNSSTKTNSIADSFEEVKEREDMRKKIHTKKTTKTEETEEGEKSNPIVKRKTEITEESEEDETNE